MTTVANELVAKLHDRMPVIIAPEDRDRYPGNQTAVWELSAKARVRTRLGMNEEEPGDFVLERYQGADGRPGRLVGKVNLVALN